MNCQQVNALLDGMRDAIELCYWNENQGEFEFVTPDFAVIPAWEENGEVLAICTHEDLWRVNREAEIRIAHQAAARARAEAEEARERAEYERLKAKYG